MFAYGIFKVIYAPHKAFKEIIENPKYIGPILIILLFVFVNVAYGYVLLSRTSIDQTMPKGSDLDTWTEDTVFWTSNGNITSNTQDHFSGTYYGNKSIEFSSASSSQIWMQLNISNPINCSGSDGYKSLSFRVKLIEPSTKPFNASLYLLSAQQDENDFFYNLTDKLNEPSLWNNITISLAPELPVTRPIKGLKLEFAWISDSNITSLIDGVFFHGIYKPAIEIGSSELLIFPIDAFMRFVAQWVVLGGLLFLVPKLLRLKTVWKPMVIIAGFSLITLFIQTLVFTAVLFAWPEIQIPLRYLGGVSGEWQTAYIEAFGTFSTVLAYIERAIYVWTIALCAIALRLMFNFSWINSLLVSALSYIFGLLLFRFLIYGAIWL